MAVFKHPEDFTGLVGCLGIAIGLPIALFMGTSRDPRVLGGLAACVALLVLSFRLSSKRPSKPVGSDDFIPSRPYRDEKAIRAKLKPGVSFKAHGSAGTPMEGICFAIIDDFTIEASVGYAAQPGRRERGPFPIANIDEVND